MTQLAWNYRFTDATQKNRRYLLVECFYDKNTGEIVAVAPITKTVTEGDVLARVISAASKPTLCFEDFKDQLQLRLSED